MINFNRLVAGVLIAAALAAPAAADTIVRFEAWVSQTSTTAFDVQLYDHHTPVTVQNFLGYANGGWYDGGMLHRLIHGFVLQGGGFYFEGDYLYAVPTQPPIVNEFGLSNTRGTIAMAKLGNDPDSATSQFFFNLGDNSANLDYQNGGFTVFGRVVNDGMSVIDFLASQNTYDLTTQPGLETLPFTDVPLINDNGQNIVEGFERVYVVADVLVGDANGDGSVDNLDLHPFAMALTDIDGYLAQYPDLADYAVSRLDINRDGSFDNLDIHPFAQLLTSAAVPEPASLCLLSLAGLALLRRRRS